MQAMKIKDVTSNLISIHSFFSIYTNYQAVKLLRSVFIVSSEPGQILNNKNPSELLFFSYLLDNLIEEVFGIVSNPVRMKASRIRKDKNLWWLDQYHTYCGDDHLRTAWNYFPRHLSKKEFLQPMIVLKKFTKYNSLQDWKEMLNRLFCDAVSESDSKVFCGENNLLKISHLLYQLMDATHLIHIRVLNGSPYNPANPVSELKISKHVQIDICTSNLKASITGFCKRFSKEIAMMYCDQYLHTNKTVQEKSACENADAANVFYANLISLIENIYDYETMQRPEVNLL